MGSTTKKAVIWGASGHALVVADILRLQGEFSIAGYLDNLNPERCNEVFGGSTVLGGQEQLAILRNQGISHLGLGVGHCEARLELADIALAHGFELITATHPNAVVAASASIGAGSVLCAGSVVNPETTLGLGVIINTCASVDHECVIADGVHICPGAHLASRVTVGRGTCLGIGSAVKDRVTIGEECLVGAGSVVLKDLPAGVMAYGVPAQIIRRVQ